jgi:hypothetical protein
MRTDSMLVAINEFVNRRLLDTPLFNEQRLKRLHPKDDGIRHIGMHMMGILIVVGVVRHNPTLEPPPESGQRHHSRRLIACRSWRPRSRSCVPRDRDEDRASDRHSRRAMTRS